MNILVTGASGFIASQIVTDLLIAGHQVTCCVRHRAYAQALFPKATVIGCDFLKDTRPEQWLTRLKNTDVVINCAGILYHPDKKKIWSIHYDTPRALFDACVTAGVKKIIQISALGIDKTSVDYAQSKKAADEYLLTLPVSSVILRPSFVYGRGSYGGSSLFRGLAGLPWITPTPGTGRQQFQPIHSQDLSRAVLKFIDTSATQPSQIFNAVGPKRITLHTMLQDIRGWLGFTKARFITIPLWLISWVAKLGDLIPYSSLNSTSYKMLMQNNITGEEETAKFHKAIGFEPRNFPDGLFSQPSTVQDRWHARLFFLRPLLQYSIAFVWLWTAICSLFFSKTHSLDLLATVGIPSGWQSGLFYAACAVDALLGIALFIGYKLKVIGWLQIFILLTYTAIITVKLPALWMDPLGSIAKNIPLLIATLTFLAMESDR